MKELGELIRAARLQKGVTLDRAVDETRIRRLYLDAIEDGDFRIFPGTAYATGFLRNYSSYLGLNPDEILQTYHAMSPPSNITIAPATTVGAERLKRRSRRRFTWLFSAFLTAVIVAAGVQKYNTEQRSAGSAPQLPLATSGLASPQHKNSINVPHRAGAEAPHLSRLHLPIGVIGVRALRKVWVHVTVDGIQMYWGPIPAGTYREWSGQTVVVKAHRGGSLQVWADGSPIGLLSHHPGRVSVVASPKNWYRIA